MDYLNFFLLVISVSLLIVAISFFLLINYFVKTKTSIIKAEIQRYWIYSSEESIFKRKIEYFLEDYPAPENKWGLKKDQKIFKEIQLFLKNDFLNKEKISSDLYVELISMLKEKQEILALDFFQVSN